MTYSIQDDPTDKMAEDYLNLRCKINTSADQLDFICYSAKNENQKIPDYFLKLLKLEGEYRRLTNNWCQSKLRVKVTFV